MKSKEDGTDYTAYFKVLFFQTQNKLNMKIQAAIIKFTASLHVTFFLQSDKIMYVPVLPA